MVLEAEHDPAAVWRVGGDEGVDLAAPVVREEAQVGPVGDVATQGWIDVGAATTFDPARAAADIAAPGTQSLDCKSFR